MKKAVTKTKFRYLTNHINFKYDIKVNDNMDFCLRITFKKKKDAADVWKNLGKNLGMAGSFSDKLAMFGKFG